MAWVWATVLAVALANTGVLVVRTASVAAGPPSLSRRDAAASAAASELSQLPRRRRVWIVVPEDISAAGDVLEARAYEWRLRYLAYPVAFSVTNRFPMRIESPYAGVVAYRRGLPEPMAGYLSSAGWRVTRLPDVAIAVQRKGVHHVPRPTGGAPTALLKAALWLVALASVLALGEAVSRLTGLSGAPLPMRIALDHLVGTALVGWASLCGGLTLGRLTLLPAYCLVAASFGTLALQRRHAWDRWVQPSVSPAPREWRWLRRLSIACIGLAVACAILTLATRGVSWDGWTIWQLKARAFYYDRGMGVLSDQTLDASHPEYPLLVPLHTWWFMCHVGSAGEKVVQATGMLFYADLVLLAYGLAVMAVGVRRVPLWVPPAAAATVASLPLAVFHSVSGYADVPLAALLLAVGGVATAITANGRCYGTRQWIGVGLLAGGAALCKNEGAPVLGLLLVCLAAVAVRAVWAGLACRVRPHRAPPDATLGQTTAKFATAALVALVLAAPWVALRSRLGLRDDLVSGGRYPVAELLAADRRPQPPAGSPRRLTMIGRGLATRLLRVGPGPSSWGLYWLLPVGAWVVSLPRRRARPPRRGGAGRPIWVLFVLQAAAYATVYVLTPHPLGWHISTSLDRLLLHLAPLALLGAVWRWVPTSRLDGPQSSSADEAPARRAPSARGVRGSQSHSGLPEGR